MPPKKQAQSTPTPKATRASTASAAKPATTTPNKSPVTKSTPTSSTQGKKRKAVSTKQDSDDSTLVTVPTPAKKAKATKTQPPAAVVEEKTAPTSTSKPTPSKKKSTTTAAPVTASPTSTSTSTSSAPASKSKSKATPKAKATPAPKSASKTKTAPKPAPVAAAADDDDDQDEDQDMTPTPAPALAPAPAPAAKPAKKQDTRTMQQKIQQRAMQLDDDSDDTDDESDDYSDLDMNSDGEFPLDSEHIRVLDQMEQKINANLEKAQVVTPKKPSSKNAPAADEKRGVIYLGHIPYGFFEDQMSGFFSQFGTVTRLRLARNKKTGRSKHYAFIEFESEEVADIVASSMNNYMMFGHTLVCERLPADRVHPNTFDGANTKFHVIPWQRIARQQHNKDRTAKEHQKRVKRLVKKESAKHAELKALGIDYAYTGYAEQLPAKPTRKTLV